MEKREYIIGFDSERLGYGSVVLANPYKLGIPKEVTVVLVWKLFQYYLQSGGCPFKPFSDGCAETNRRFQRDGGECCGGCVS